MVPNGFYKFLWIWWLWWIPLPSAPCRPWWSGRHRARGHDQRASRSWGDDWMVGWPWKHMETPCPPNGCFYLENMWQYGNMMIFTSWFLGDPIFRFWDPDYALGSWNLARARAPSFGLSHLESLIPFVAFIGHTGDLITTSQQNIECCFQPAGSFFCCQPNILRGSPWYFAYVCVWPANQQLNSSRQKVRWSSHHSAGRPQSLNR